jgi:uncharacterized protein (DUF305 family)
LKRPTLRRAACAAALAGAAYAGTASGASAQAAGHAGHAPPPVAAPTGANPVDVAFMQGMIGHHAQALVMARLVPERSDRRELQLLAERILVSQQDEIAAMQRWLRDHRADVPAVDDGTGHGAHAAHGDHTMMPGMLTAAQLDALAAARGDDFDRLFLSSMIRHHEGALVMVAQLFKARGAGQDPTVFEFATEVDTDQRAEIARMAALLRRLGGAPAPR